MPNFPGCLQSLLESLYLTSVDEYMMTITDPILWISAPSIGFRIPKIANAIAVIFRANANPIPILMILIVFLAIPIRWGMSSILSLTNVISAASMLTSLPPPCV